MAKPAPILTALGLCTFMGVRDAAPGGGNVGKQYYRFLVHSRQYLHISDGFATPWVEAASGIRFRWRPFNARAIMQEMDNVPFATKPVKLAYMWRDVERRASRYELAINVPAPYPLKNFDLASRVAVVGEMEGWCPNYVRTSYRRWFVEGKEVGTEPNLSESLSEIGQDPDRVIVAANAEIGWPCLRCQHPRGEAVKHFWLANLCCSRRAVLG